MAFEGLSDRLQNAMGSVTKKGKITEADLKQMMREVRLALLEADVNFKVVKDFVRKVNERALGSNVLEALSPAQQVVKIVNEELTELMGGEQAPFQFSPKPPTVVMMVGLQGAGKTTTAGKLASFLAKHENKPPLLVAADVYRPAAIDQLQTLGKQLNYPVFSLGTDVNPVEIARQAIERATIEGRDLVIIDTAGRLHIDEALMEVSERLYKEMKQAGVDVLLDDRKDRAGVKFKDADLIGYPVRITVSKNTIESGEVELRVRKDGSTSTVKIDEVTTSVQGLLRLLKDGFTL